jgi:type IV pilus assembly protein PilE
MFTLTGGKMMNSRHGQHGFTLIELLITIVIVAIITAIAVPSYQAQVARTRRADARTVLLQAAQLMERIYTTNNCYLRNDANCAGAAMTLAAMGGPTQSPIEGTAVYNITLQAVGTTTYTLQAVPVVGGPMAGDACGTLTLDETGAKGSGGTDDDCWNR